MFAQSINLKFSQNNKIKKFQNNNTKTNFIIEIDPNECGWLVGVM